MKNRVISLVLSIILLFSVTACGGGEQPPSVPDGPTVVDGDNRTIAIPEDGSAVKIASVYGTAVPFIVALDLSDQVVAINCKSNFWKKAVPALNEAGSVGRGVVDMEGLAQSGAGVLIHRSNDDETVDAVVNLGVEVLCIRAEDLEGVYSTLELMGQYFGKQDRAKEVIDWMDKKFEKIDTIVAQIPEENRASALVMGGELGRIAGGDMIQSWMIEKAGGIAVAADIENDAAWTNIGVETIFQWNPDYIFCTSSASLDYTIDEILTDPAWSDVTAVKNADVAIIPSKIDTWDMPGIAAVLSTFWMLNQMYPEYFTTDELKAEIDEYYTFMFDQTFEPGYLGYSLD